MSARTAHPNIIIAVEALIKSIEILLFMFYGLHVAESHQLETS
jgi:hypothetical protein